jgi:hypothetical protein
MEAVVVEVERPFRAVVDAAQVDAGAPHVRDDEVVEDPGVVVDDDPVCASMFSPPTVTPES